MTVNHTISKQLSKGLTRFVRLQGEVADFFGLLLAQGSFLNQCLFKDFERGRMPGDGLVQFRLREHGLIELVVSVASIANHIDNDIGAPLVTPLDGGLEAPRNGHGIVPVAMKDGAIERLTQIARIGSRTAVDRIGGETDLVVDNDVNRPPHLEIVHAHELHRFVDDSLSREGGVSVEEDGDDVAHVLLGVAAVELLGACFAEDDGVDAFEVGSE